MENETRLFLVRIANTISLVLLWMMLNVFFGLYLEMAFMTKGKSLQTILFYLLSTGTFIGLIYHLKRKWKI